jgi:3',5'-nucleoside bisphosphate phosphatase
MIDLHMHSSFSDGSHTPEELIEEAVRHNITAVALTDHDTVRGIPRFLNAAVGSGIQGIAGVEISTAFPHGELHLLGYMINHKDPVLGVQLDWIRNARQARNEEILHKLNKLGLHLSWRDVRVYAGQHVVGRPHFARAMVARGYVGSVKEAFRQYLSRGAPAYAKRRSLSPQEGIEVITGAGGVAVLAHPCTLKLEESELWEVLQEMQRLGLGGLEVYYPAHQATQIERFKAMADELGLVATGGTDYHGQHTPDLKIGHGYGGLNVPDEIIEQLLAKKESQRANVEE